MNHTKILVTGSAGQIGSELVPELSKKFGKNNVVATIPDRSYEGKISNFALVEILDVRDKEGISKLVARYDVNVVYHLAGILSAAGEENPELAYDVNLQGLHNILEVSMNRKVARVFWPSSIAVFGPNAPKKNTPQDTSLVPTTIYGVTKVAGELLCNYYFTKYGLDVRSIRFPGIISSETRPSGGTTDYAVEIFYEALIKKRYTAFVKKETVLPMLYMPDCIKSILNLMETDPTQISIRTSYNLGGLCFSVEDLANEIRKHIPELVLEYKPDFRQRIADSWPMSLDDSAARLDWGWAPSYDLTSMTSSMIERLGKRLT
ncbi:MAG: NAD-dependent epimerase/dehydratase family protein [Nitrososphaerota archaeon]|nr:NAD-dependent epimerase/dehydratase family protein [Nitrososphaerota archaeon]